MVRCDNVMEMIERDVEVLRLVETGPTVAGAGHGVETQCQ